MAYHPPSPVSLQCHSVGKRKSKFAAQRARTCMHADARARARVCNLFGLRSCAHFHTESVGPRQFIFGKGDPFVGKCLDSKGGTCRPHTHPHVILSYARHRYAGALRSPLAP